MEILFGDWVPDPGSSGACLCDWDEQCLGQNLIKSFLGRMVCSSYRLLRAARWAPTGSSIETPRADLSLLGCHQLPIGHVLLICHFQDRYHSSSTNDYFWVGPIAASGPARKPICSADRSLYFVKAFSFSLFRPWTSCCFHLSLKEPALDFWWTIFRASSLLGRRSATQVCRNIWRSPRFWILYRWTTFKLYINWFKFIFWNVIIF